MKKGYVPKTKVPAGRVIQPKKEIAPEKPVVLTSGSKKGDRYFVLFFFLFAFILYGNTILNKFAVDDNFVTNNQLVQRGFKALPEIFSTHYVNQQGNLGSTASTFSVDLTKLGLKGRQRLRDLWRQKDLGIVTGSHAVPIAPHGVLLLKALPR